MVVGEISMTPGMMANLFRIQSTVDLLELTRTGLSTGLEVNTPLDDPVSFFAARAHWNRADDITNYKTAMAEAIQTIKAADSGIDGVTALLQAARGVAESALQADKNAMEIDLRNASAGDVIEIGGTAFSLAACDSVTGARVPVGASDLETARNLADAVNNTAEKDLDVTASVDGAKITLRAAGASEAITSREIVDAAGGGDHFRVSDVINHRAGLADQYHSLMEQVDAAAGAPGFRGVNLLKSDRVVMTVKFEGGSLDVTGFDASAAGLGAHVSATRYADIEGMQWAVDETIDTDIAALEDALEKLGIESSRLSSNTSVITTRRAFSTSMTDLLLAGADGLTSAEAEEEGANMLMLQTWQDLSITSLALSAEAAQAALRLF